MKKTDKIKEKANYKQYKQKSQQIKKTINKTKEKIIVHKIRPRKKTNENDIVDKTSNKKHYIK